MRAAITQPSVDLCSAPCKARRSAPPTRVPRWPSGLDGACAQLAGLQWRDGHSLRLESKPGDASVRKSLADAFYRIGGQDVRDGSAARA
jgi:hypothetical protein